MCWKENKQDFTVKTKTYLSIQLQFDKNLLISFDLHQRKGKRVLEKRTKTQKTDVRKTDGKKSFRK